jgi:hypothetical protein
VVQVNSGGVSGTRKTCASQRQKTKSSAGSSSSAHHGLEINLQHAIEAQKKANNDAAKAEKARNEEIQRGVELAKQLETPTAKYAAILRALNAALAAGKISWKEYQEVLNQAYLDDEMPPREGEARAQVDDPLRTRAATVLADQILGDEREDALADERHANGDEATVQGSGRLPQR